MRALKTQRAPSDFISSMWTKSQLHACQGVLSGYNFGASQSGCRVVFVKILLHKVERSVRRAS